MSATHLRWALSLAARRAGPSWTASPRALPTCGEEKGFLRGPPTAPPGPGGHFSTEAGETPPAAVVPPPKKKKQDPNARTTINSVGRKIHLRLLQVMGVGGESLGNMHRSDAIRLMDEQGLKLVLVDDSADPPLYQLMSGKQIHEEQLKLREKQKAKPAAVQVKELTFSSDIASHDLSTKLKQVQSWLEKKNHVRITLRAKRTASKVALDQTLDDMVQQMPMTVGFVAKPKVIRDGRAMCILRPPSAKELAPQKEKSKPQPPPPTDATPQCSEPGTPPDSPAGPADASKYQA
ncbi:translation initiation factor IF-3, mitochondrial [Gadus chalcogrammus]|uniref:translation initiation factor IF-3, mitochondrial n=1 Tax=Gadus chalcogrammus TaxID=1042646 RepID=UPI0024C48AE3|nr:translation initiation factor IF-3, mitochondrial [Gadus chalcogrammus]